MSKGVCEEAVFRSVFLEQAESLRNFLYYKTGDLAQAEDLMQDAFSKLWEHCAKVLPEKAKAFLFKVAGNLFLNTVAHQKVVLKFEQRSQRLGATGHNPQQDLEASELKEQLMEAIAKLPETQRIVFLMNRIDGKTYREIAALLEISVKAVEKRMHKALVVLREVIKEG